MTKRYPKTTFLADMGLLYASAIWGSTFFVVKAILRDIDPLIMVGYRFLLAALLMLPYLLIKKIALFQNFKTGLGIGVLLLFLYGPQTIGLGITSAANSALITGMFVAFVPILNRVFFKRRSTLLQWLAVLVSLTGLWILTGGLQSANLGDVITILASVCYAAHILWSDSAVQQKQNPFALSFQQFLVVGVLSLLLGAAFKLPFGIASPQAFWVVVFLAAFPSMSAFMVMLFAQRYTAPLRVSLIFALEPVFGALFAWTLGGESVAAGQAFGGVLIFVAIVISTLPKAQ